MSEEKTDERPFLVQSDVHSSGKPGVGSIRLEKSVITFTDQICCTCGMVFAIPDFLQRQLKENHRTFYCPNGHSQCYAK